METANLMLENSMPREDIKRLRLRNLRTQVDIIEGLMVILIYSTKLIENQEKKLDLKHKPLMIIK